MTAQLNNNQETVNNYTLYNKGVGLKLISTKAGKPLLIGSCIDNAKMIFASPFTAKKANKDGSYSQGLVVNVIDGKVVTYTDNNGVERQKVETPSNRDDQVSKTYYLYERGVDSGIYGNKDNEASVTPVDEAEDGSYRPDFNLKISQPNESEQIPF